jgi:2'-5' RNA ligase
LADEGEGRAIRLDWPGDRELIRRRAVTVALDPAAAPAARLMRAFLAIPLPEAGQARRHRIASAPRRPGLRLALRARRGAAHHDAVLGAVDPARSAVFDAAWREATRASGRPHLRLRGAALAPSPARPRILWLHVVDESGDDRLATLARRLESAARDLGFPPEDRPFSAHVTLARAQRGARAARLPVERIGDLGSFVADRLVLYRSDPLPGGSVYREEASYALPAGETA